MKFLLLVFAFFSTFVMAQVTHREATAEETELLLPEGGEEELYAVGTSMAQEKERMLVQEALILEAMTKGQIDETQRKGYIQHLTNQGLTSVEIIQNINDISDKYFAALQLSKINLILSEGEQEEHEQNFLELQGKYEDGKLAQEELDLKLAKLNEAISASPITIEHELKRAEFQNALLATQINNIFVKDVVEIDPRDYGHFKVMVPNNSQFPLDNINLSGLPEKKPLVHQVYFSWGYNRGYHTKTDVKFTTPDGTFTVHDTVGKDRQSPFDPKIYFNPTKLSIPQYNVELGVMFNEKWGLELKQDHMKLVFDNTRPYEITGDYNHQVVVPNENPVADWDAVRPVDFEVAKANKDASWLKFEHSDGYNYISVGAVYNQNLYQSKNEKFGIDARFGAGAGLMIPKTFVAMHQDQSWNWEGLDNKFHIAGGGVHGEAKLKFTFWNSIYLQAATRGTYIKVKDALVDGTESRMEHVQPIGSVQLMGQIGYQHTFKNKNTGETKKKKVL